MHQSYEEPPSISYEKVLEILFQNEPPKPNSIKFQLELEDGSPINNDDLFSCLRDLLVFGFKKFYGDVNGIVDLSKLKQEDFEKLNKYFNAIGFRLNYQVNSGMNANVVLFADIDDETHSSSNNQLYEKPSNGLSEQIMTINCKGKKYTFYFTLYTLH